MIIIFVGADMCGKTNIAHQLSRVLNIPVFKASSEHGSFLHGQDRFLTNIRVSSQYLLDFIRQTGSSVIFDREFPCEYAYSKHFNRETDIDAIMALDEGYSKLDTLIIHCKRKSFSGIRDDLDQSIDENSLNSIQRHYDDFRMISGCKWLELFVDDENIERELKEIREKMLEVFPLWALSETQSYILD